MEPEKRHRYIKYSLAAAAILVALGFCGGIIYAITDYYANEDSDESPTTSAQGLASTSPVANDFPNAEVTGGDLLDYFQDADNDGLYVTFVHGANSISEMDAALLDDTVDMLEADITLQYYGLENQTTLPIMAHPPVFISDNTFSNWLDNVIPSKKGIKMDIKVEEVIPYALKELRLQVSKVNQPVWINADVIKGPNTQSNPINGTYFVQNVNEAFPNVTLSLGWTTGYRLALENDEYSWESMDQMLTLSLATPQRITFPIRAALAKQSWYKFLWLLEQEDRFSLTVWSASTDPVSLEDKIYIRDNYNTAKVFYDTGPDFVEDIRSEAEGERTIEKTFYTGGNVLDFFRTPDRDGMKVTWAHRANNEAELEKALQDDSILMLEADVRTRPDGVPVMAHTSADIPFSDQTLEQWLDRVKNETTKGIKLDVKTTNTLEPSFSIIASFSQSLKVPIWLNSDVLRGPNSVSIPVNASVFFDLAEKIFPHSTLSPGWTTAYNPLSDQGYTQEMVEEMYSYCKHSRQAITFPVRASLTGRSIGPLKWLVENSNRYSLTVWHSGQESVPTEELVSIRNSFKASQVFYDLPEEMMEEFQAALQSGENNHI